MRQNTERTYPLRIKKNSVDIILVKRISGTISVSSDKSISHLAIIFTSLASGKSTIKNFSHAEECVNTLKVLKRLGVRIIKRPDKTLLVEGKGRYGLRKPIGKLHFGNSDTGIGLMTGILASQLFSSTLTGDISLSKIPVRRITVPLAKMGANIKAWRTEYLPLEIKPGVVKGILYNSPETNVLVKSCILLAGLYSDETTTVTEPYKSKDHTERMMQYFNIPVNIKGNTVAVAGGRNWPGRNITIPGDFSSAAFFITACLLISGSSLKVNNVNLNPTRTGFIDIIKRMGGKIKITGKEMLCNEPVGDIQIDYAPRLNPVIIQDDEISRMIDEIPLIILLATRAKGKTIINGIGELRKKETSRLHAISTQLQNMGQSIQEQQNSLVITGCDSALKGVQVESCGDCRMAMVLTVAGLLARGVTTIRDINCLDTSFSEFLNIMESIIEPGGQ